MFIETLECRRMLSTVTEAYPGYYEIQAAENGDVIEASVSMADKTFTLNGTTYGNVSYILVNGGAGNDLITISSEDGPGTIGAGINARGGQDLLTLNFDGAIWGGDDSDVLFLSDSFRGEAYGEGGADKIYITDACVNANIHGGGGNDFIDCTINECPVVAHGDAGNDTIYGSELDDEIYGDQGNDVIYARAGDDVIYSSDNDTIDGGDGYDAVVGNNSNTTSIEHFFQ